MKNSGILLLLAGMCFAILSWICELVIVISVFRDVGLLPGICTIIAILGINFFIAALLSLE